MKIFNQQDIKNTNLKQVLTCVQNQPGTARVDISKKLGLSKPAVSSLVDELIVRHFLVDSGTEDSKAVGRKPNHLYLQQNYYHVAVFYLRKDKLCASVIDIAGKCFSYEEIPISSAADYLPQAKKYLNRIVPDQLPGKQILGIGVIVPAMINAEKQTVFSVSIPFQESGFVQELQSAFPDYTVALLNNTACMAYAEKVYAKVPNSNFAFVNIGYGIGSALFVQGELLGNATGYYMQMGHYSVDPNGPQCSCGKRGCLEIIMRENTQNQSLEEIGDAALYGDPAARENLQHLAYDFSLACINMICFVHPSEIVLGGSKAAALGPYFLQLVQQKIAAMGSSHLDDHVLVRLSQLDAKAVYYGAMKYLFDHYYNFTQKQNGSFYLG